MFERFELKQKISGKFFGVVVILVLVAALLFARASQSILVSKASVQATKYVVLTFDDSDIQRSNDQAVAIMDSFGVRGVAFATVQWTNPAMPVWNQILQEGWEVGSHVWTHSNWYPNELSASLLHYEVAESKVWFEQNLGTTVISFAYPGNRGYDNATVVQAIRDAGYLYARAGPYPSWANAIWHGERSLCVDSICAGLSTMQRTVAGVIQHAQDGGIVAVNFHCITDTPSNDEFGWGYVTPDDFRYFLQAIMDNGLQPVTFKEWDQMQNGMSPTQYMLTVTSAHGSPAPSVGEHPFNDSSSATCTVTSPVVENGISYTCTGWSGTGSVPSSGTGTSTGSFAITQNSSITWNWVVTQRELTVNSAHDNPDPSAGAHLYDDGSSVTCKVTGQVTEDITVWTCTGWSGTGSVPSSGTGNSVTFTISENSTITWNWQGAPVQRTLTVFSAHDSPSPPNGNTSYSDWTSVTCNVASPVTEGDVTYVCAGWSGTGSVPASSTSSSVTFTITRDSSIIWNWIQLSSVHLESTQDNNATSNLGAITLDVASHPASAIWIEPATVDVAGKGIGDKFNVTVWTNTSTPTFAWQVTVNFDSAYLNVTGVGYTSDSASQFFAGHTIVPVTPVVTSSSVSTGASLIGSDSRPAGSGSLCWVELELLSLPNSTVLSIDNADTFCLNGDLSEITSTKYNAILGTHTGYGLPNDCQMLPGTFSVLYTPTTGYQFDHWETSGSITVLNVSASQTTLFASGLNGTLKAIYAYWRIYDINHDGVVDMKDVGIAAHAAFTDPQYALWNPIADITGPAKLPDGKVNMMDIGLIARHFQEQQS